jgi:hypothetical protein
MDAVFILKDKPTKFNDVELRYSLRSLKYFEHDQLWIVTGNKRDWVDAKWIRQEDTPNRWENGRLKVNAACKCSEVSDPFLMLHDDILFTQPIQKIPHHYDGTIEERIRGNNTYAKMLKANLRDSKDGLNYAVHMPLVVHKGEWLEHTKKGALSRNLYCSWSDHPKKEREDVKLRTKKEHKRAAQIMKENPFVSLSDYSLMFLDRNEEAKALFEEKYGEPCGYELD